MQYFPLIWATLWSRKARTFLTLGAVVVAFLLFGLLITLEKAFTQPQGLSGADKLITMNRDSVTQPLPRTMLDQVKRLPGVREVTSMNWFAATWGPNNQTVFAVPIDVATYFKVYRGTVKVDEQAMRAFQERRDAILIGADAARKNGWKVGERITLHSTVWPQRSGSMDWTFEIVGIAEPIDASTRQSHGSRLLVRADYFDEARLFGQGTIGWMVTALSDTSGSDRLASQIDAQFANSTHPTETRTAQEFALVYLKQLADVSTIIKAVLGAVFFTLLLLTANTMAQAVRERKKEIAVMRTLGFGDIKVIGFITAEGLLLCLIGAAIGLGASWMLLPIIKSALQGVSLNPSAMLPGVPVAIALALVTALPPAIREVRRHLSDALTQET